MHPVGMKITGHVNLFLRPVRPEHPLYNTYPDHHQGHREIRVRSYDPSREAILYAFINTTCILDKCTKSNKTKFVRFHNLYEMKNKFGNIIVKNIVRKHTKTY